MILFFLELLDVLHHVVVVEQCRLPCGGKPLYYTLSVVQKIAAHQRQDRLAALGMASVSTIQAAKGSPVTRKIPGSCSAISQPKGRSSSRNAALAAGATTMSNVLAGVPLALLAMPEVAAADELREVARFQGVRRGLEFDQRETVQQRQQLGDVAGFGLGEARLPGESAGYRRGAASCRRKPPAPL